MKMTVLFMIETGNAQKVEAAAFSNETANIYITAADLQEAAALLPQGQELAVTAMKDWKPEEQPVEEEPQQHYYVMSRSMEEMNERAQAYEESPEGKRFLKTIENAKEFTFKHSKGGLLCTQVDYLANKHYNSLLNGSFDLTALAYRRGYMNGKAAAKK